MSGFSIGLDVQSMIWHNTGVAELIRVVQAEDEVVAVAVWMEGQPMLLGLAKHFSVLEPHWQQPLPDVSVLLSRNWPCIADIFCALRDVV